MLFYETTSMVFGPKMNTFDKNHLGNLGRALTSWNSGLVKLWHQHWLARVAEAYVLWTLTTSGWMLATQDVPTTMTFLRLVVSCGLVARNKKLVFSLNLSCHFRCLPYSQIQQSTPNQRRNRLFLYFGPGPGYAFLHCWMRSREHLQPWWR